MSSSTANISRPMTRTASPSSPSKSPSPTQVRVLMSRRADGRAISFFGDLHPSFAGNVVKAMGSAKQGYPVVSRMLAKRAPAEPKPETLAATMNEGLRAAVHAVTRLTPNIVEVTVKAPFAARGFEPGQFYRLQNYEANAIRERRHGAGDGRAGADRRLGRQGSGPALDHRARDGRVLRSLCHAEARRTGHPDGPDRHADRDSGGRDRAAGRRRARQRRAVLDRAGAARRRAPRWSISPATSASSTATRSRRSSAPPTSSSGAATKRRASMPRGRRISPSSAISSRRWRLTALASSAAPRSP